MKVLFLGRKNLETLSGGDKIQILKTKEGLEQKGVVVEISTTSLPQLANIDLMHVFNPAQVSLKPVLQARRLGIPVAMSTIHWDQKEYYRRIFSVNGEYLTLRPPKFLRHYVSNQVIGAALNFYWYGRSVRHLREMFELADVLLPNSQAEVDLIIRQFRPQNKKVVVVPNGVDFEQPSDPDAFYKKYHLRDFILCAGRIEYRKNQLALIKALLRSDIPLVFVGAPFNPGYNALCRHLGKQRKNVFFINHLPHEEVLSAYAAARVHALPSWYETPGLANLEAAIIGANIAVSDRGCTREYFGQWAEYCDPKDVDSIRRAVETAYQKPKSTELRNHIRRNYTWECAAGKTLAAYELVKTA